MTRISRSDLHLKTTTGETFLVLPENELAYTGIKTLADDRYEPPSPLLFLHGPSGSGKSRLAQHLLKLVQSQHPRPKIEETSAADFLEGFCKAAQDKVIHQFQQRFDSTELLVFEDVHLLEGHLHIQEQLLAICDKITHSGRILVTSRKSPGELNRFSQRLINRFIGGTCLPIRLPLAESRQRLLTHFAAARQMALSPDAAELLAAERAVSPRELLAMIGQLEWVADLEQSPVHLAFVQRYLKQETSKRVMQISEITRAIAGEFRVSVAAIRSRDRHHSLALPRQCAMLLARELTGMSLVQIGRYFGNRDHATVIYACRRIEDLLSEQPALRRQIANVRISLNVEG